MSTAEPDQEDLHDPEVAEEFAEAVGTDPTHDQIEQYLDIAGAPPLTDPGDNA
jgi:hypothetical protein